MINPEKTSLYRHLVFLTYETGPTDANDRAFQVARHYWREIHAKDAEALLRRVRSEGFTNLKWLHGELCGVRDKEIVCGLTENTYREAYRYNSNDDAVTKFAA